MSSHAPQPPQTEPGMRPSIPAVAITIEVEGGPSVRLDYDPVLEAALPLELHRSLFRAYVHTRRHGTRRYAKKPARCPHTRRPELAIVDEETWERANGMAERNRSTAARRTREPSLLKGLVYCEHDHDGTGPRSMYYDRCGTRQPRYRCSYRRAPRGHRGIQADIRQGASVARQPIRHARSRWSHGAHRRRCRAHDGCHRAAGFLRLAVVAGECDGL